MDMRFFVFILIEIIVVFLLMWGFIHEDRFIAFEDRIISKMKRKAIRKMPKEEKTCENCLFYGDCLVIGLYAESKHPCEYHLEKGKGED